MVEGDCVLTSWVGVNDALRVPPLPPMVALPTGERDANVGVCAPEKV